MNILFITADQWRGECLSMLGHPVVKTPCLDSLAKDSVTFKRHYAQATPCGPSRACLYTGMYLQNHRSLLNGTPLDARHTNVALEARKSGYQPALFGYTDTSLDPREFSAGENIPGGYEGVLPGMDPVVLMNSDWQAWRASLKEKSYAIPDYPDGVFKTKSLSSDTKHKGISFAPALFKAEDSSAAFLADKVISYVSDKKNDPWFVHLSLYSPHPPFVAPEPFHAMYDADDMPPPVRCASVQEEAGQHPWVDYYLSNQQIPGYPRVEKPSKAKTISDLDLRQIRATYFGMMSEVDVQIGRVLDHLKCLGCYDETLIIFTSDHGEQLGDHWMFSKFGYYDQTFHIPLIIHHPSRVANGARGSVVSSFTESIDVMPTILQAIGQDIPVQCDGCSLQPFLYGAQPGNWRQEYHAEFDIRSAFNLKHENPLGMSRHNCSVNIIRDEHYKYVHFNGLPTVFFDLKDDPNEFRDRSADPAYQGHMLEYTGKMLSWRMQHDDPALTNMHIQVDGAVKLL